jgi:hypothetical protein
MGQSTKTPKARARATQAGWCTGGPFWRLQACGSWPADSSESHVALSGLVSPKLGLCGAMGASGIGKAELARRLAW